MFGQYKRISRTFLAIFVSAFLLVATLPSVNAATRNPSPSVTSRTSPNGKASPTPTPKSSLLPLNAVYADTNVPQISDISSFSETVDGTFVLTVALSARIHRNTISSINIGLAQKTTQGAYVDPIFQEPCTKLSNISVSSLNTAGDSTALQSRAVDGDWYLEKYVLTSKTPVGTNQQPCQGQYLITSMAIVDAAKHTLNVVANVASTVAVASTSSTSSSGATRNQTPSSAAGKNNDTAIMTSNIWNTRIDLAPCSAGTNVLPTITTSSATRGTPTQTITPATIIQTNRVACAPTINIDFARPLITIVANLDATATSTITGVGLGSGLPIFDYAAVGPIDTDVVKLNKQLKDLKKKNSALSAELAKYKKSKTSVTKPKPLSSPSAARRNPLTNGQNPGRQNMNPSTGSNGAYPQGTRAPTRRSTPSPAR